MKGYSATAGDDWMRPELCQDALRLGRILAELVPHEAEVHGLVATDGNSSLARGCSRGLVGRAGVAPRSGSLALGPAADPPRPRCARSRREPRRRARTVCAAGRDRGLPRASARAVGNRLGAHRRALCCSCASDAVADRRVESRGRGRNGARSGSGTRDCRFAAGRASLKTITFSRACAANLLSKLGRRDEARAEFERAASLTRNSREKELLLARAQSGLSIPNPQSLIPSPWSA